MAELHITNYNPFRFHSSANEINYTAVLPILDKMYLRTQYNKGIYPVDDLYPNFVVGKTFYIQYYYQGNNTTGYGSAKAYNVNTGSSINLTSFIYNVAGFGISIYVLSGTITVEGEWYIQLTLENEASLPNNGIVKSDIFKVKSFSEEKDLVKINYYDTGNANNGYFFNAGGTQVWNPVVYYTGFLDIDTPSFDTSDFTDEENNTLNLTSTPKIHEVLTITDIHKSYVINLQCQFACDHIYVNDVRYSRDGFEVQKTDNSDIVNIIIQLSRNENENMQLIS